MLHPGHEGMGASISPRRAAAAKRCPSADTTAMCSAMVIAVGAGVPPEGGSLPVRVDMTTPSSGMPEGRSGKRTRNVYTITDEGRDALSAWVATPTSPPQLEAEAMLRLLFADHGTIEHLESALYQFDTDTRQLHAAVLDLMNGYLRGEHPFPQRTHLSVLFATFQLELFTLIEAWVEFAKREIADWPSTRDIGMDDRTRLLTQIIVAGESVIDNPRLAKRGDWRALHPDGLDK